MAEEADKGDKTEDPTQKRLDEALRRGDVVKSQEVGTFFIIGGGALVLAAFAVPMTASLTRTMEALFSNSHAIPVDSRALPRLMERLGIDLLAALALPFLVFVAAGLIGHLVQHRPVFTAESIKPKVSKISPGAGVKRLFSKQALMLFLKGIVKLAVLGGIMAALLWPQRKQLDRLAASEPEAMLPFAHRLALELMGGVVAVLAIVAALDYLYQYRTWFQRQKMSVRDLKDEFKQTEGDPVIRGKIRQMRQNRMRKRMMAAVPTASVIITNPTHFAVALRYERGMNAPVCVAKGVDALALRIRAVAAEHRIPVIENPPLARTLHASVQIDDEIPAEHYKAVADVISYVMRLRQPRMQGQRPASP